MVDKRLLKEGQHYKRQVATVIGLGVCGACGAILQAYLLTVIIEAGFLDHKRLSDVWL